jgi:hypothetical protein
VRAAGLLQGEGLLVTGAQAATVAGIAAVGLGLGYAVGSMGGGDKTPAPSSKKAAAVTLPAVTPASGAKVKVAVLGAAPALPAPKRSAKPRKTTRTPQPRSNPTPAPTSAPTAAPTSAPTSAPTAQPTPARTPDTGTIG